MKAVVIHAYGGPEQLKFEERPDPIPGPGEVLVRLAATSVNPIDTKLRSGQMKDFWPLTFPAILGVDVSGVIHGVGSGVSGFSVGDNVFVNGMQAYASLCVVKAADLAKIPSQMDIIKVAALPTVTTTGAQLAELATRGKSGGTVLVTGAAGNVGRSAVFIAKENGWTVIAGVRKKQMVEAKATGADRVVALDDDTSLSSMEQLDAVADTVSGQIADKLLGKVKKGGDLCFHARFAEQCRCASRRENRDHGCEARSRDIGPYGRSRESGKAGDSTGAAVRSIGCQQSPSCCGEGCTRETFAARLTRKTRPSNSPKGLPKS